MVCFFVTTRKQKSWVVSKFKWCLSVIGASFLGKIKCVCWNEMEMDPEVLKPQFVF